MPPIFEGRLDAADLRFAIVASRFNDEIVSSLLSGAIDCLARHGAPEERISVFRVPGAFEIPSLVARLAPTRRFDAVVTLGALIRGDTPHFDFISNQVTLQISAVSIASKLPVSFGVITCNTMEQARERCRKGNNKGWEAALSAIEMASLYRILE